MEELIYVLTFGLGIALIFGALDLVTPKNQPPETDDEYDARQY